MTNQCLQCPKGQISSKKNAFKSDNFNMIAETCSDADQNCNENGKIQHL